ncbi:MAG: hypothetical protein OHK0046_22250 [Anaerolineae bacterium]
MKTGLILPNILSPVNTADVLKDVAQMAEQAGFDSIWTSDHVLMPREFPQYGNGSEALITLAYLAGVTARVELGTGILLLPMRNPLVVAKQVATLDDFAGGRTILGVGVGWNEAEFQFLNADFKQRGKRMDEYIDILRTLWTEEAPEHTGTFSFSNVTFEPKPKRQPPIYIGGNSEAAIQRAARLGDGWLPNGPRETLAAEVAQLRALAGAREVTVAMAMRVDMREGSQAVLDMLMEQKQAGLEYPTIRFVHEDRASLIARIEQFVRDVLPHLV